ncbi:MAG: sugar phosphate isomerase/epimerase [Pseudomonadota bacterium]
MQTIGYQLYSSRNHGPLSTTFQMLSGAGYRHVEGYGALFGSAQSVALLKVLLGEYDMTMPTAHVGLDTVRDEPGNVMALAKDLGIGTVVVPALAAEHRPVDAEGWQAFARRLDDVAQPFLDAGLRFAWHNHDFELADIGSGTHPLDILLETAGSIGFEIDVAWIARAGADPLRWINAYGSRIVAVHLKDLAPPDDAKNEDGWADFGHGILDWARIIPALAKTDVQHWIVEHDNPSDDARFARRAAASAGAYLAPDLGND